MGQILFQLDSVAVCGSRFTGSSLPETFEVRRPVPAVGTLSPEGPSARLIASKYSTRIFSTAFRTIDELRVVSRCVSPHPGPLPMGEGELGSVARANHRLSKF